MTTTPSPRRRGASFALGGILLAAGALLAAPPIAVAAPSTDAVDAINDRYATFGGEGSLLGAAVGEAEDVEGGAKRDYQGGAIYYSKDTGAHVMYGAILERYEALGGPTGSDLGFPKNDESDTGDGVGRFNDFSAPEGASIYWNPQVGASVLKGKVLEAWRQSGGITGPFGYPSADMSVIDGVQTAKFTGPEGTEIQWSKAAGLVTIPTALAAGIPGFGAEGTASMSKPSGDVQSAPATEKKSGFKWWWLIPIVALLGLLAFLPRLFRKPAAVEPARVAPRAPEARKVVTPPPPPAAPKPVVNTPPPPPPPRPAPVAKPVVNTPPVAKPVVNTPTPPPPPPPAPRPTVTPPPAPRLFRDEAAKAKEHLREEAAKAKEHIHDEAARAKEHIREEIRDAKAEIRQAVHHEPDMAPVIKYESTAPAETTMQVTYENNAVGEHEESRADKSDVTPDHLQE